MTMSYENKLHDLALAFIQLFPNFNQTLSLHEFLTEHQEDLSEEEFDAGYKILCLFD